MRELTQWKESELKKCAIEKRKAIQMFNKLKLELEEMKSIANPSVAMDISSGKLHQVSLTEMSNGHLTATIDAAGEENMPTLIELAIPRAANQPLPDLAGHKLVPARQVSEK